MSETTYTTPTIHGNGTGRETLQRDYDKAADSVLDATASLEAIEFNGRDYYPPGLEAWDKARRERADAFRKLRVVMEYIEAIREAIYN